MMSHLYFVGVNERKENEGGRGLNTQVHIHVLTHPYIARLYKFSGVKKLQRCNTKVCIRFILLHIGVTRDAQTQIQIHMDAVT